LALIYPSRYEGFGLPVLEAMSEGCPVVCSEAASLPEVGGDAAVYFDPTSVESLESALTRLVSDARDEIV
jgi:glycosyltransferase involved in cell wall biosynthesis